MVEDKQSVFSYSLSQKDSVIVVSFVGDMSVLVAPLLEKCLEEILRDISCKFVIFDFTQVKHVTSELIPVLVHVQKAIRLKPAELRICSLRPEIRTKLARFGILRTSEVTKNLKHALHSIGSKIIAAA